MMNGKLPLLVLALVTLTFSVTGFAQDVKPTAKADATMKNRANASVNAGKRKGAPKLVDINSAPKKELRTLPGITETLANRIIAGRPYNSKYNLLTRSVVPQDVFAAVRKRIEVR